MFIETKKKKIFNPISNNSNSNSKCACCSMAFYFILYLPYIAEWIVDIIVKANIITRIKIIIAKVYKN